MEPPLLNSSNNNRLDFASSSLLFGRENELEELKDLYQGVCNEGIASAVFVMGAAGTGKSSLVEKAFGCDSDSGDCDNCDDNEDNRIFVQGKFDQFSHNKPFSALLDALEELCQKLPAGNLDLLNKIQDSLGNEAKHIAKLIPSFSRIYNLTHHTTDHLDPQNNTIKHASWGYKRLKMLFRLFINAVTKFHTVILFLDDLQWSDDASMEFILGLLETKAHQHHKQQHRFFFVASVRTHLDPNFNHRHLLLHELEHNNIKRIHLQNLSLPVLNQFITSVMGIKSTESTHALAEVVWQKTLGNPFFVIQCMELLQQHGHLRYSYQTFEWEWDLNAIQAETDIADCVVEIVASKIQRLPQETQEALMIGACLGNRFDADVVNVLREELAVLSKINSGNNNRSSSSSCWDFDFHQAQESIQKTLQPAVEHGLVNQVKAEQCLYRFR